MLSKILRGAEAAGGTAIGGWPSASRPGAGARRHAAASQTAHGEPRDARRIAELEQQVERRAREARQDGLARRRSRRAQPRRGRNAAGTRQTGARASRKSPALRPQLMREAASRPGGAVAGDRPPHSAPRNNGRSASLQGLVEGALQKLPGAGDLPHPRPSGAGAGHPPGARRAQAAAASQLIADPTLTRRDPGRNRPRQAGRFGRNPACARSSAGLADRLPER